MDNNNNRNEKPQRFSVEKVIEFPGKNQPPPPSAEGDQTAPQQPVRYRSDPTTTRTARTPKAQTLDYSDKERLAIRSLRKAGYSDSEILRIIENKRNATKVRTSDPTEPETEPQMKATRSSKSEPSENEEDEAAYDPQYVPPVIGAPPGAGLDNLKRWGGLAVSPFRWLLSEPENAAPAHVADTEPLPNWLWFTFLIFGIATFLWDVNLSQAVMIHIFPAFAESTKPGQAENIFVNGLTFNVKAGLSGGLISIGSSVAQFLFLRKLKLGQRIGRLQYTILFLAIAQNWVFSVVGYTDFFRHENYFEWNPAATQLWPAPGTKSHVEWGSIIIMIGALLTAILPELCFSELPRGSKTKGHYVQTNQGWKWVDGSGKNTGSNRGVNTSVRRGYRR